MYNNFFRKFIQIFILFVFFEKDIVFAHENLGIPFKKEDWITLSYRKIPANQIDFEANMMTVKVSKSAGPIVYKLKTVKKIVGFSVSGNLSGNKKKESGSFDEDSILRLGLVVVGEKTLSGPKKWLAPEWIKELFDLAPKGTGLDKIYFYNITNRKDLVGKIRIHPNSDLLSEKVIMNLDREGDFEIVHSLDVPQDTMAVWLSIDGDDTASEFKIGFKKINFASC